MASEIGMLRQIAEVFVGKQSRKVAFGVWGFWVSNGLIVSKLIGEKTWWYCFLTSALLIGFGTVLDNFINKIADRVADKVAGQIEKTVSEDAAA